MNLTPEQKTYLVPASIGAAVFVVCDELLFPSKGAGKKPGKPNRKSLIGAVAGAALGSYLYEKSTEPEKADIEKYALPVGGGAVAFAAVNRFSAPLWPAKNVDRRPYALGAAAVAAWLTAKPESTSPTVGRLQQRTFEPPFPPPFGPEFPPEFEG